MRNYKSAKWAPGRYASQLTPLPQPSPQRLTLNLFPLLPLDCSWYQFRGISVICFLMHCKYNTLLNQWTLLWYDVSYEIINTSNLFLSFSFWLLLAKICEGLIRLCSYCDILACSETVNCPVLIAEARVRSRRRTCDIKGDKVSIGQTYLPVLGCLLSLSFYQSSKFTVIHLLSVLWNRDIVVSTDTGIRGGQLPYCLPIIGWGKEGFLLPWTYRPALWPTRSPIQ